MGKRFWVCVFVLTLFTLWFFLPAFAEIKFKRGVYLREWHEYLKNYVDLSNDSKDNLNYFKLKTSLWGQADFDESVSLYAKLSNENTAYTYFGGGSGAYPDKQADKKGYHYNINEVFFENLYLDVKDFMNMPVDLRIGRQDLAGQYGEGFLIFDGNPGDGPRSVYFNAAKASWRANDNNTLDILYINDPRTDQFLPVLNRDKLVDYSTGYKKQGQYLTTSDEQGYVLYWKNKAVKNLGLEGYYIFKRESEEGGSGPYSSEKTKLSTMGSFLRYNFAPYTLRTQVAGQWGTYGKEDRRGLGGYIYLDRDIREIKHWSPKASLGAVYLSGDDRKTNKQEGWDPLFSRWPSLSELYMFTSLVETGIIAYWTNLQDYILQVTLQPTAKSKITLAYNYLRAVETVPSATAGAMFSGTSKERGHLPQFKFEYTFNKHVNGWIWFEYFMPGRFYANDDAAMIVSTAVEIRF